MTTATIEGLEVVYETRGSGPPLLMLAPSGEKWTIAGGRSTRSRANSPSSPTTGASPGRPATPRPVPSPQEIMAPGEVLAGDAARPRARAHSRVRPRAPIATTAGDERGKQCK
jgi:hypothetical protein